MTGITAEIRHGYTGADHLIDARDMEAVHDAVADVEFRRAADALAAAERAFRAVCDPRVRTARIVATVDTRLGVREVG